MKIFNIHSNTYPIYESSLPTMKETLEEAREKYLKGIPAPRGHSVNLVGALLVGSDLGGANLSGLDLRRVNFRDCNLRGANLTNCDLGGARFEGADLTGADVTGSSYNRHRPFNRAVIAGLRGYMADKPYKILNNKSMKGLQNIFGDGLFDKFNAWKLRAEVLVAHIDEICEILNRGESLTSSPELDVLMCDFMLCAPMSNIGDYYVALKFHSFRVACPKAFERDLLKCFDEIIDKYQNKS